jgi:hypothetical protein
MFVNLGLIKCMRLKMPRGGPFLVPDAESNTQVSETVAHRRL